MTAVLTDHPAGWIANRPVDATAASIEVIDPAAGSVVARVGVADAETVDRAVTAAVDAFESWADLTPVRRDDLLAALAQRLLDHQDELAQLEALDTGKPVAVARGEIDSAVDQLRFFGGAARVLEGKAAREYVPGRTSFVRRDPVGVIGQITPWNYPLVMAVWKIGPALAAGNTVVLKPSELTPLSTLRLAELAADVLPAGVLNVVAGDGPRTGTHLATHPGLDMLCVTGSVATGQQIMRDAVARITRTHLELGGKAPVLVFEDSDVAAVVRTLRVSSFWNAGQDCTAACRVIAQAGIHDALVEGLREMAQSLRVGGQFDDPASEMGPVISADHRARVLDFVDGARMQGATIETGGEALDRPGWFVAPTVISNVGAGDDIARQEVFGPVVTVERFDDEAEALALANASDYGLSASVWTNRLDRALRLSRRLRSGAVWINDHLTVADEMPHGGFKMSGYGKDLSTYAIEDYTVVKHVMARIDPFDA